MNDAQRGKPDARICLLTVFVGKRKNDIVFFGMGVTADDLISTGLGIFKVEHQMVDRQLSRVEDLNGTWNWNPLNGKHDALEWARSNEILQTMVI